MFENREIVCAIEFGTSKICVLLGAVGPSGLPEIIGRGMVPSGGSVVKGEIFDADKAFRALEQAIEMADKAAGHELTNCGMCIVLATGCGINAQPGVGVVTIKSPDGMVSEEDLQAANENARILNLAAEREVLNTSSSFCLVDGRRVGNPLRQVGSKLESHVHIVHGISSRIENFRSAVRDSGFENVPLEAVFSPLASDIGVLSEAERDNGVLLIDIGAGTTEYLVEADHGLYVSGVLQLGMEHVANDLAIGLNLHIDTCRKLISSGELERASREQREYLEFPSATRQVRKIPFRSFEAIADARLREIFEVVRTSLVEKNAPRSLGAGGVLTGGGALFYRSGDLFREVFDLACRIGRPGDTGGAVTGMEDPRYSAVWGALKIAAEYRLRFGAKNDSPLQKLVDHFNRMLDHGRSGIGKWKESF